MHFSGGKKSYICSVVHVNNNIFIYLFSYKEYVQVKYTLNSLPEVKPPSMPQRKFVFLYTSFRRYRLRDGQTFGNYMSWYLLFIWNLQRNVMIRNTFGVPVMQWFSYFMDWCNSNAFSKDWYPLSLTPCTTNNNLQI